MKRTTSLLFSSLLLSACGAVGPSIDGNSGGDATRDGALGVFVDRTVTDRIAPDDGDHTDWKYLDVLDPGSLRWKVAVNNPEQLTGAEVSFHDEFGEQLERRLLSRSQGSYVFAWEVKKAPKKFYVRVHGKGGKSAVYSTGAELEVARKPEPPPKRVAVVRPPEPEPEPEPKPRPRKRYKRRRPKPKPKKVTPPPPPPAAATVVTGMIVRVTPSDDNTSVSISARLKGKVRKGASGAVLRNGKPLPGGRFRVSSVKGRRISARVNLPEGQFSGRLTVTVQGD